MDEVFGTRTVVAMESKSVASTFRKI